MKTRNLAKVAVCLAALALVACEPLTFYTEDFQPDAPEPLNVERFVLNHYKDGIELYRLIGETATYETRGVFLDTKSPKVYLYEEEPPFCQYGLLTATKARLYLVDDWNEPQQFLRGDIDFFGDVRFLERRRRLRMTTDKATYHSNRRELTSQLPSETTILQSESILRDNTKDGFTIVLDKKDFRFSSGRARMLQGEEAKATRAEVEREFAEADWVCGPEDIPVDRVVEAAKR